VTVPETVFTYGAPALKFGVGAADEVGYDVRQLGVGRCLVVTDPGVAATGGPERVAEGLRAARVRAEVWDGVHVEPTDASMRAAVEAARASGPWDGVVAVGGGSSIDTAKVVALLTANEGDLLDYVNAPIGGGRAPERPLVPLVAVPTTTGTGSESTTIAVLDVLAAKVKTGISHARLRPVLAVVDPLLTLTQPPLVTAASGLDVLCHALESYTARPYTDHPRKQAHERVPYCGANPVSDLWAERALGLLAAALPRAVADGADLAARTDLALAATFAGMGFGNAGVHVPHANAYPIAGRVRDYRPAGYPDAQPLVPHGIAVALTAPEAFRFTFAADPGRHLRAVELLAPSGTGTRTGARAGAATGTGSGLPDDDRERLPAVLTALLRKVGLPNGLAAVGYGEGDVDELVTGAMQQQRLLATAPLDVREEDLAGILRRSMTLW
jgi:hydroxyacid-oxoacid transhydrogenase